MDIADRWRELPGTAGPKRMQLLTGGDQPKYQQRHDAAISAAIADVTGRRTGPRPRRLQNVNTMTAEERW